MKGKIISVLLCLLMCTSLVQAGQLETLTQKLPKDTFGCIATSGTSNFQSDFEGSIIGQIAADAQVKIFFEQLVASISKAEGIQTTFGEGDDYIEFVEGMLASPTLLALAPVSDVLSDELCGILLSGAITPESNQGKLFAKLIQAQIASGKVVQKKVKTHTVYTSNDPNTCDPYYIAPMEDCFLAVFDDAQYTVLEQIAANVPNYEIAGKLSGVGSGQDALVVYADFQKFIAILNEESAIDPEAKQTLEVLRTLGLAGIQQYIIKGGFEDKNLVIDGKVKAAVSDGIWNAFSSADKDLFNYVDPKAMQANAFNCDPIQIYDSIMGCVNQIAAAEGQPVEPQIAQFEETIGFKLRDDFLESIEGSFMGYMLPAYASPELLTGGYVVTAKLKNAVTFQKCMLSLETTVKTMAPTNQLQITSQKDAAGKEVHIWAVGVMAMMQIIPSWAVESDTLIIASHPAITKSMMERIASGAGQSLISDPEFANAFNQIPGDAYMMGLTNSKAQARQFMKMLQQYWPMLNMGLMQEGIQLPIMLPSIEAYIEQMQPGLSYARKVSDGLEFHYEGTGLEATSGSAAGGAMGLAILMPALTKTKKVAQRVVSGTNLKAIGTACVIYANDHEGKYPSDLQILISECDVSPESLESARKPTDFEGPDFILIQGLTDAAPASTVLAYENPVFCHDGKVNVLYCDGHVSPESKDTLKLDLKRAYEYLKKPMPQLDW